jgi:hypothetical protein
MRDLWFNRCKFIRVEDSGVDPVTRLTTKNRTLVLDDEPCDLVERPRSVAVEGPGGRSYQVVKIATLKLDPLAGASAVPDENDSILVDGAAFVVQSRLDYTDPGSGRYMGTELTVQRTERTDNA